MGRHTGHTGHVGRTTIAALTFAAVSATAMQACEVVLGISAHDSHPVDTAGDASSSDATTGDGGDAGLGGHCAFRTSGDARMRVGILAPDFPRYDVCVTAAGAAFDGAPLVASAVGDACPDSLGYKDVTAPIALAAGSYDVKIVPRGARCDAAAIAHASNIAISAQKTVGVYLFGDDANGKTLKAWDESRAGSERVRLRLLNFMSARPSIGAPGTFAPPLTLWLLNSAVDPPTAVASYADNVPYASTASADPDAGAGVDSNGYAEISAPDVNATFGISASADGGYLAEKSAMLPGNDTHTAFAIGRIRDPRFPPELYVCDEGKSDGLLTRCGRAAPATLTVATHDAYLWGVFAPFPAQRRGAEIDALAAVDADVVCVSELWSDADKRALIDRAKARFPYALSYADTATTTPNDPADQNGVTPPPPTSPPCLGSETKLNAALDCLAKYCAVTAGDDSTPVASGDPVGCITTNCLGEAEALFTGTPNERACWSCSYTSINDGSPIKAGRTACTTDANARWSFKGGNSVVVLSRFPIDMTKAEEWVLPSTEWRIAFLRAPVQASPTATVDVYCGELTSPQDPIFHPYTGSYSGGAGGANAWRAEQLLQAKRLAAHVARRSAGQIAIVGGEFYAGPAIGDAVTGVNTPAFEALSERLALGLVPGFASCTFCNDNPITTPPGQNPTASSTLTTLLLLYGMPATELLGSSTILTDATISLPAAGYSIPPSPYYGVRSVVRVRF